MNKPHLKKSLLKLCAQPRTLEYISKKMGGLDPIKITSLLNEMEEDNLITLKENYWSKVIKKDDLFSNEVINEDFEIHLKKYMGHFDFLKNPHPLDFEWRNTSKSLNFLTDLIGRANANNDKVLLLGMPTLFANCATRNITQQVTLIERNPPIIEALKKFNNTKYQVIQENIFSVDPKIIGKYDSVIMDPPWYTNFLHQFVWLAAKCLEPSGLLIISIPPINTRDNIDKERIEWFSFCQQQGLCIERLEPERLEYAMPFFEFNAFRAAGVENILPFWRKGDLAFFRKISSSDSKRPKLNIATENWKELQKESIRIRINLDLPDTPNSKIKIKNLIAGDIIPSVSRSYSLRREANLWTSGNRAFKVNNPHQFWEALNQGNSNLVNDWFQMIVEIEKQEYKDYLEHIYYEMERNTA